MTLDEYILSLKSTSKFSDLKSKDFQTLEYIYSAIKNNPGIIKEFIVERGLKIIEENETGANQNSSPVCYANDPELREEFRDEISDKTVTYIDILHCVYALYKLKFKNGDEINFNYLLNSVDNKSFNEFANIGSKMIY